MFVIEKERKFTWTVKVSLPQENGTAKVQTFIGHFKLLPREEYQQAYERVFSGDEEPSNEEVADFLLLFMTGWGKDIQDPDGNPIEFNRENLLAAIQFGPVLTAILNAYGDALSPPAKKVRGRKN